MIASTFFMADAIRGVVWRDCNDRRRIRGDFPGLMLCFNSKAGSVPTFLTIYFQLVTGSTADGGVALLGLLP
jgi:hypothetical protein